MPTQKVPVHITPVIPNIRVFRRLDTSLLSTEFVEKVSVEEDDIEYVDANRARDAWQTEEIMEATLGAALVDAEGNVLAEFEGPDAYLKAEKAKASARVTFSMEIEDPEGE